MKTEQFKYRLKHPTYFEAKQIEQSAKDGNLDTRSSVVRRMPGGCIALGTLGRAAIVGFLTVVLAHGQLTCKF